MDARSVAVLVDAEDVVAWYDGVRVERILAEAAAVEAGHRAR